mgnify:CR=1 FL=1
MKQTFCLKKSYIFCISHCHFISFRLIFRRILMLLTLLQASSEYTRQSLKLTASVMGMFQQSLDLVAIYGIPVSLFQPQSQTLHNLMYRTINTVLDTRPSRHSYSALSLRIPYRYTAHGIHTLYSYTAFCTDTLLTAFIHYTHTLYLIFILSFCVAY